MLGRLSFLKMTITSVITDPEMQFHFLYSKMLKTKTRRRSNYFLPEINIPLGSDENINHFSGLGSSLLRRKRLASLLRVAGLVIDLL